ncbi:MurR/RpiR family transcriptional regulator [Spiroplasma eriocheiris]|uniref:RpiR family transcriptional regulato n=1 Tax=Spiroplasma eriocheiris TaxID=315358 RepID=A0A0H3XLE8_9MOLU|nr:MurR/RpiR family transcriptional regulator [Spiroplasma eriocheiris]AHF58321.1 putative transcriptional regulator [Spiroplasma eriocheiris CCTCC M 207170]AKM54756.1 RpiR family transcriptional regulato [Spiroplasma eriocheiris]
MVNNNNKMKQFNILEFDRTKLTNVENAIFNFINENPNYFTTHTINEIAIKANVSVSGITRFVKKVGYHSLKLLQQYIYERNNFIKYNYSLSLNNELVGDINNNRIYYIYAINQTVDSLDHERINKVVDDIIKSRKVLLFGVGSSWIPCFELASNLNKIGIPAILSQDIHVHIANMSALTREDLIILISTSGTTNEIREIIRVSLANYLRVILITANEHSEFKNIIDNIIQFKTYDGDYKFNTMSAKVSELLIVDIIYSQLLKKYPGAERAVARAGEMVKPWRKLDKKS